MHRTVERVVQMLQEQLNKSYTPREEEFKVEVELLMNMELAIAFPETVEISKLIEPEKDRQPDEVYMKKVKSR
jgi:hypothetical protein